MIDRNREQLIPITRIAEHERLWPKGRTPHRDTISRWARLGCRGVRLESVLLGGRRYTSLEAIERFITKLSEV